MTRNRISRLLAASGATIIAFCALPGTASAQFSPCGLLGPAGAFLPPPCIIFDYKKLADFATTNAKELQKISETTNTINQAKATTQSIVSDARDIASYRPSLSFPNVNTDMGPLLNGMKGDIAGFATKTGDSMFAGTDGTTEAVQTAQGARTILAKDGNVEAYAYGIQGVSETDAANTRYAALMKAACKSKDVRTDWAANSSIKIEVMNARARQAYLLSAFVRVQASNNVVDMPSNLAKGINPGSVLKKAVQEVVGIDQSDKVNLLRDLILKASGIMASVQVTQMSQSAKETLKGVIADYDGAVARKAQIDSDFRVQAASWVRKSKHNSVDGIINTVKVNLDNMNNQMSSLRNLPMDQLAGAFRDRNIDVNAMTQNDVDPRQFLGNWADPLKYQNTLKMSKSLLSGGLDKAIEGESDNNEFLQMVYNYQDAMLEVAWKKSFAEDAVKELAIADAAIQEENDRQGKTVTAAGSTADLEEVIKQANALGQDIGASADMGSKQRAADLLAQLQGIVADGTSLPVVEIDTTGGGVTTPVTTPVTPDQPDEPVDQVDPRDKYR